MMLSELLPATAKKIWNVQILKPCSKRIFLFSPFVFLQLLYIRCSLAFIVNFLLYFKKPLIFLWQGCVDHSYYFFYLFFFVVCVCGFCLLFYVASFAGSMGKQNIFAFSLGLTLTDFRLSQYCKIYILYHFHC